VTAFGVMAIISVMCAVLLAAHYRDLSFHSIGIVLAISISVAALIAIPWLLNSGWSVKQQLAKAGAAALLLVAVGFVLLRVAGGQGEEGTFLVVLVNIGGVFGLVPGFRWLWKGLGRRRSS